MIVNSNEIQKLNWINLPLKIKVQKNYLVLYLIID